jgi:hypothetical protein
MECAIVCVFVGVVTAVVVAIARPHSRDTFAILAVELAGIARMVLWRAHATFVDSFRGVVALALSFAVETWMTALSASAVVLITRIRLAHLT